MSDEETLPAPCDEERRDYFRIDDQVRVSIRPVPEEELDERLDRLEKGLAGNFTVMSSLAAVSSQMAVSMRRIEGREPDIAEYLRALDRKIEVLGRAFLAQESDLVSEQTQRVNLSAGGLCLDAPLEIGAGGGVEIKMLLFPSFTGVLTYGQVVECAALPPGEREGDYTHRLRIAFTHMRDQDRDILIRHILRRQGEALRARRAGGGGMDA